MATKGKGGNVRDQAKWDRLQDEGGASIDKILAGKASTEDIAAVSKVLAEQHELAGQMFDDRVAEAETTAATIVDKLNKDRQDAGKRPLTQKAFNRVFESTFQKVMSEAIEDILAMVHDEFENQSTEIRDRVGEAIEKLKNFTIPVQGREPAPAGGLPPLDQSSGQSLMDRFMAQNGRAPESSQGRRSLMDRFMNRGTTSDRQRTSILTAIKEAASGAKDRLGSIIERLRNRGSGDDDEDKKANTWIRKLKSVFGSMKGKFNKVKTTTSKVASILGAIGKPLLLALMNPQLIKGITDAVSQYLNFDTISKFVSDTWDATKKIGSDSIDWVIDKVMSFLGLKKDSKDKAKAQAVPKTDPLKAQTQTGALPKTMTADMAKKELPRYQDGLERAQKNLADAQARYKANPTEANRKAVADAQKAVSFYQMRVTQFTNRANEGQANTTVAAPAGSSAAEGQAPAQGSTTTPASSETGPVTMSGGITITPPKTEIVADSPKFEAGKAIEPQPEPQPTTASTSGGDAMTSRIGMGSFGFDSGDSALTILNTGMLA